MRSSGSILTGSSRQSLNEIYIQLAIRFGRVLVSLVLLALAASHSLLQGIETRSQSVFKPRGALSCH